MTFSQALIDVLGLCPRCHRKAHAFDRVSEPVSAVDGPYGLCAECNIYWRLPIGMWMSPQTFDANIEITRTIVAHCEEVDTPSILTLIAAEYGKGKPSPELVARVMAEAKRGEAAE